MMQEKFSAQTKWLSLDMIGRALAIGAETAEAADPAPNGG